MSVYGNVKQTESILDMLRTGVIVQEEESKVNSEVYHTTCQKMGWSCNVDELPDTIMGADDYPIMLSGFNQKTAIYDNDMITLYIDLI